MVVGVEATRVDGRVIREDDAAHLVEDLARPAGFVVAHCRQGQHHVAQPLRVQHVGVEHRDKVVGGGSPKPQVLLGIGEPVELVELPVATRLELAQGRGGHEVPVALLTVGNPAGLEQPGQVRA
jgi:hypothetical protein